MTFKSTLLPYAFLDRFPAAYLKYISLELTYFCHLVHGIDYAQPEGGFFLKIPNLLTWAGNLDQNFILAVKKVK